MEYFLPNFTVVLQPLDQGVIKAVKTGYRYLLMKHILHRIDMNVENKTNIKETIDMISGGMLVKVQS